MAYYVELDQGTLAGPTDIQPSFGASLKAAVESTAIGNVSQLGEDYAVLQRANQGQKVPKDQADALFKQAGVKQVAPDDGYTRGAIDILIQRRLRERELQRIDASTPWSWVGSPVRGGAMLLAGVVDPLNFASAFIPVVGEARAASLLARAGESAFARFGARAGIGAVEGLTGAALLEVPTYGLRTALQDDYHMSDSLLNLAFGAVGGAGLHGVGGFVGDALQGGGNPYARYAGLSAREVRQVMDFESGKLTDSSGFSPAQRRLIEPMQFDALPVSARAQEPPSAASPTLAARQEIATVSPAPFAKLYEMTPERAAQRAFQELGDDMRAELLALAGQRAEPRAVANAKQEVVSLTERRELLDSEAEFKRRVKLEQQGGLSRKQAEAAARKEIAAEVADVDASQKRLQESLDSNAAASRAEQQLAGLEKGEVPPQFAARVDEQARGVMGSAEIARAITGVKEPPAAFVIGMASPETREALMRSAIADFSVGRMPAVEALLRTDPVAGNATPEQAARAAAAQRAPEASYLADRNASESASKRAAEATVETDAEKSLAEATERLEAMRRNLEATGIKREELERLTNIESFDEEVKRSKTIGEVAKIGAICGMRT